MTTLEQYTQQYYPQHRARPVPDYIKIAYLLELVAELETRLTALEKPPTLAEPITKFPRISSDICRCGENKDNDLVCPNCGGMLF